MTDETFSAKQVARRIGTDAKTFRKWLRSSSSPYPAVGQGKRYEFPVKELPEIRLRFEVWKNKTARKNPPVKVNGHSVPSVTSSKMSPKKFAEERKLRGAARDEEYGTIDGEYPDEPTEEDLAELMELEALETDEFEEYS
jgi:hypothetical protein